MRVGRTSLSGVVVLVVRCIASSVQKLLLPYYTPHLRFCKLFRSKKSRLVVRAVHRVGLTKAGIFKNERIKKAICTERTEAKQPCAALLGDTSYYALALAPSALWPLYRRAPLLLPENWP
jgi:hypothetical protein